MSSSNREFRVVKLCQKLCKDIVELQGTADKKYRYTICQDIRKMSETVIHLVREANDLPAGFEKRIEMQEKADKTLEDIKDLIWVVGKLLNTGVKKEAQIELSIENLQIPLHNWMEKDQKISVSAYEKAIRKQGWILYQAKKTYEIVKEYYQENQNERTAIAYDESQSRCRIAYNEYKKLIESYDRAVKRLRDTQDRFHKDDSVLSEVLKEIESKKGIKVSIDLDEKNGQTPSDKDKEEKKKMISATKAKILESEKDSFSESTIQMLTKE